jgi:hypothetical protein
MTQTSKYPSTYHGPQNDEDYLRWVKRHQRWGQVIGFVLALIIVPLVFLALAMR